MSSNVPSSLQFRCRCGAPIDLVTWDLPNLSLKILSLRVHGLRLDQAISLESTPSHFEETLHRVAREGWLVLRQECPERPSPRFSGAVIRPHPQIEYMRNEEGQVINHFLPSWSHPQSASPKPAAPVIPSFGKPVARKLLK